MPCRASSTAQHHPRRTAPCSPRPFPRGTHRRHAPATTKPAPAAGLEYAAGLVATVAGIIPAPGASLCVDDDSWNAFDGLVTEAADLVAGTLGDAGAEALRVLQASSRVTDPVRQLLIQRALERLTADERSF